MYAQGNVRRCIFYEVGNFANECMCVRVSGQIISGAYITNALEVLLFAQNTKALNVELKTLHFDIFRASANASANTMSKACF